MIITTLTRLKRQVRWPYPRLCESLGLPYASFRRGQRRLERGQPALFKPGPHKVAPLKLEELRVDLYHLKRGRQRSRGVGRLYRQYQDQISRRDLQGLTDTVRREPAQQRQAELRPITWQVPGLVWSLDDAEWARFAHHKLHLHQVQDLASRYKFTPWVGERVLGETVAVHLEELFLRCALPLDGTMVQMKFLPNLPNLSALLSSRGHAGGQHAVSPWGNPSISSRVRWRPRAKGGRDYAATA